MSSSAERKDTPVSMRLPEADIALIDRAAQLCGRSRTEFVRNAAVRAAEETPLDQQLIRMRPEAFAEFSAALSGPVQAVPEMVEILNRPAPWEQGFVAKR